MRTDRCGYLVSLLAACLLVGLIFPVQTGHAQPQSLRPAFERLQVPGSGVTRIVQDLQGFMWFATWNGLHRYDGYEVKTYWHDPTDSTSLSDNWVEALYVDGKGTLWVGTYYGGLNRFDPITETFTHYRHDPNDATSLSGDLIKVILEDHSGTLWVGTYSGLNRFDGETKTFIRYQNNPDDLTSLSDEGIKALYEDQEGRLWVGTEGGGLNLFDRSTETFTHYRHDPEDEQSLWSDWVMSLYEDRQGRFWVGTWGDGLHLMDREANAFTRYRFDPNDPDRPHRPRLDEAPMSEECKQPDGFTCPGVSFIHEDASGMLWIGGFEGGLDRYAPVTGARTHYEYDRDDPMSLGSNRVGTIYESRDGSLWIGTWEGLFKLEVNRSPFAHFLLDLSGAASENNVQTICTDRGGDLWVGTRGGLFRFDPERGTVLRHYQLDPDERTSLSNNWLYTLNEDHEGVLWVGTLGGLNRFDRQTETFTQYRSAPDDPTSLSHDWVTSIYDDHDGVLWIGTQSGLNRFNRQTETFTRYQNAPDDPTSLGNDRVTSIYDDHDGVLWIGTQSGLNRFNRQTETFTRYQNAPDDPTSLGNDWVTSIYEDHDGVLWVGTRSGLNRFDRQTETFTPFTTRNSDLPDNYIKGILGGDDKSLWLSTAKSLVRFDLEANIFRSYRDLAAAPFNVGVIHRGRRDQAFVGGMNGFHAFYPETIEDQPNAHAPEVVLIGLSLFDEPVTPGASSLLEQPLWQSHHLMLQHNQNVFSIDFAGLHYADPLENRHRYLLEGYDVDWREAGSERQASYVRVPPGTYVFRVKAANSDGVWSEEGARLNIEVLPPWWRSNWAYVVYALLLIAAIFAVDRVQRRRLIRQERAHAARREQALERENAKKLKVAYDALEESMQHLTQTQHQLVHAEKMASLGQMTAGIAHEIKNPLNFVNNFAELSIELADELGEDLAQHPDALATVEGLLSHLKQNAAIIAQHGTRADAIVKSMMQHASSGMGERRDTEVNALLQEYVNLAYHGKQAQEADFGCEIKQTYDEAVGRVAMVPQEMGRVFLNVLSNAFDAVEGQEEPVVRVSTRCIEGQVEIRVSDNGPGIPAKIKEKIFEPFFTTKPTGSGTGLGLSLSYDIVTQGHGGTLTVESAEGEGAAFVITLPA